MEVIMSKSYKLIVAYDGTEYCGWIQQLDQMSVLQSMADTFLRVFGQPVYLLGASKTDAGVHALGQVALAKTDLEIDVEKLKWAWNNALPESISIKAIESAPDFHPHHNVLEKTYWYHLFVERPLPFYARYGVHVMRTINWNLFDETLQAFVGSHNFQAFYTGNDREDTMRTINAIHREYNSQYNCYRVIIRGKSFLRHMVRRMIGAALTVATHGTISVDVVKSALKTGILSREMLTAPAKGLMLYEITYNR